MGVGVGAKWRVEWDKEWGWGVEGARWMAE